MTLPQKATQPATAHSRAHFRSNGRSAHWTPQLLLGALLALGLPACSAESDSADGSTTGEPGGATNTEPGGSSSTDSNQLFDARDGRTYATQAFGTQVWMTENLAAGVVVEAVGDGEEGATNRVCPQTHPDPSDPSPCDLYGGYYDWATALALPDRCNYEECSALLESPHQGICPEGWHIPTNSEFEALATFVANETGLTARDEEGNYSQVGASMRDNTACETPGTEAPASGFNGLPSGYANTTGYVTANGLWTYWQTTEHDGGHSYGWGLGCDDDDFKAGSYYSSHALPVRCVKDH